MNGSIFKRNKTLGGIFQDLCVILKKSHWDYQGIQIVILLAFLDI